MPSGPGDIMPDNRRYGVIWMSERALAGAYNLKDGFSSVAVKLLPGASEGEVIRRLDDLLERYGGRAAYGRKDQTSHAWLDHELDMLNNMSRTLPPIFLLVTAFLVNLTLGRLVALEREHIGLLKALGYTNRAAAAHYLKFVLVIALAGIAIGSLAGTWIGSTVTQLFGDFFRFPFLLFSRDVVHLRDRRGLESRGRCRRCRSCATRCDEAPTRRGDAGAGAATVPAHTAGDLRSQPNDKAADGDGVAQHRLASRPHRLHHARHCDGDRHLGRVPVHARHDGVLDRRDVLPGRSPGRHDDISASAGPRTSSTRSRIFPGFSLPSRRAKCRCESGVAASSVAFSSAERRRAPISVASSMSTCTPWSFPRTAWRSRPCWPRCSACASAMRSRSTFWREQRRTVTLPVAATVEDYFGIRAMMDAGALQRLMREGPAANSVHVSVDTSLLDSFYAKIKTMPVISGLALQRVSLENFREAVALLITTMASIYAELAAIIAFGVVYNNARISLSESARDLASLRVIGFTRAEVLQILLLELALLTLIAQPAGWAFGYGLAWIMKTRLAGELMRVRLVVEPFTYALASMTVILAALFSALVVRSRVYALDLVSVLKTRD